MISFPLLTIKPAINNFSHKAAIDPVHRVKFASGAVLTRILFTKIPLSYHVYYSVMSNADKLVLETWERNEARYGGEEFNWTNPKNEETYVTHLLKPIKYKILPLSNGNYWQVDFDLVILP